MPAASFVMLTPSFVIPAQAGIQYPAHRSALRAAGCAIL